jgi:hypothetical protein
LDADQAIKQLALALRASGHHEARWSLPQPHPPLVPCLVDVRRGTPRVARAGPSLAHSKPEVVQRVALT